MIKSCINTNSEHYRFIFFDVPPLLDSSSLLSVAGSSPLSSPLHSLFPSPPLPSSPLLSFLPLPTWLAQWPSLSAVSAAPLKIYKRPYSCTQWQDDYPFHHNCEVLTWADSSPLKELHEAGERRVRETDRDRSNLTKGMSGCRKTALKNKCFNLLTYVLVDYASLESSSKEMSEPLG